MSGVASEAAADSFDDRRVDLTSFHKDLTADDWAAKFRAGDIVHGPWFPAPVDTISPTKTVGKGRTNLTLGAPDILQCDAATPYASLSYRSTPAGGPFVSVHFDPAAYGITSPQTFVIAFLLESSAPVGLVASGYASGGTVSGTGAKTLNGKQTFSVVLGTVPAGGIVTAAIQQTSPGGGWMWYATSIEYPPILIHI